MVDDTEFWLTGTEAMVWDKIRNEVETFVRIYNMKTMVFVFTEKNFIFASILNPKIYICYNL